MKKKTLWEFFEENNCTEEERERCHQYLQVLRVFPYLEEIKELWYKLNNCFKK
jgi:hypothetical protein